MIFREEAYSESFQTSQMKHFLKIVNYFHKKLHLRCLKGFWIRLCKVHNNFIVALSNQRFFCFFSSKSTIHSYSLSLNFQKQSPHRCSVNKVFLEVSQNSQVFSCEFCEISKDTFSYRTPPVAASELCWIFCTDT